MDAENTTTNTEIQPPAKAEPDFEKEFTNGFLQALSAFALAGMRIRQH